MSTKSELCEHVWTPSYVMRDGHIVIGPAQRCALPKGHYGDHWVTNKVTVTNRTDTQ